MRMTGDKYAEGSCASGLRTPTTFRGMRSPMVQHCGLQNAVSRISVGLLRDAVCGVETLKQLNNAFGECYKDFQGIAVPSRSCFNFSKMQAAPATGNSARLFHHVGGIRRCCMLDCGPQLAQCWFESSSEEATQRPREDAGEGWRLYANLENLLCHGVVLPPP